MNTQRHRQAAATPPEDGQRPLVLGISRTAELFRFGMAVLFMIGLFGTVGWKFCKLHLDPNEGRLLRAMESRQFEEKTRGERGSILDSRGNVMAMDLPCNTVAIDAKYAETRGRHPIFLGNFIAKHLELAEERHGELQNVLVDAKRRYWVVAKDVDFRVASKLRTEAETLKLRSVLVSDEYDRSYPKGNMCSHVIGFSTLGGGGVMGLEAAMNKHLQGREGRVAGRLSNNRREMVHDRKVDIRPTRGADVHLTIDMFVQQAMEDALDQAMEEYKPLGAWSICMRSKTGEILGMASRPHFDPNLGGNFFNQDKERGRNRCISFGFEPGSVLKPLSIAAVMNESLASPQTPIFCHNGQFHHAGHRLRDAGRSFATLTLEKVVMKSSNIGTAVTVLRLTGASRNMRLGMKRLSNYYRDFGLGERSGLGLPEEDPCPIPDYRNWSDVRLSRVSIGQGIRINALQLCGAINTIANGGLRMQPYIVDRVIASDGEELFRAKPKAVKQVIRPEVAQQMREMMRKTVMAGRFECTGYKARVEGYETAGKTGTAQKYIYAEGRYSDTRNISSFVGFVPAADPEFTLIVVLDEPKGPTGRQLGGGSSAGIVFKAIAGATAQTLGVPMEPGAEDAMLQARQEKQELQARQVPASTPQIQRAAFTGRAFP